MDWPTSKVVTIKSLAAHNKNAGMVKSVSLLGHNGKIKWHQYSDGLEIQLPEEKACDYAFAFKISFRRDNCVCSIVAAEPPDGIEHGKDVLKRCLFENCIVTGTGDISAGLPRHNNRQGASSPRQSTPVRNTS